ncbi:MAG: putative rane protein [Frankiales bacterium]|jgi:uncharacterized membrane protein YeaQ/YmgE (transglycosylase-associated protein family)|nr:putative rane protein [Frankiales bacterium]
MVGFIISLIIIGAIAGFIARALVPGKDSMSVPATIALGIVGSFVGGFLARLIGRGDGDGFSTAGIIGSIIGAVIALLVYNAVTGKKNRVRA